MTHPKQTRTKAGDWVEVISIEEIRKTLDEKGTLDGLVFMPEMVAYCGRRFQVSRRAEQVCTDGAPLPAGESSVRGFKGDDVLLLGPRCDGSYHDGCKRGCLLFWKEQWVRKVEGGGDGVQRREPCEPNGLAKGGGSGAPYYCQSSELIRATYHLGWGGRVKNVVRNVARRNYGWFEMASILVVWFYWRVRQRMSGIYPKGTCKPTPNEALELVVGEWVEVKSLGEIVATLDENGKNRGLHFSVDMIPYCGKRFKVWYRADRLIAEGTGVMRQLKNTVVLEGGICDSAVYAFGGCPREDLLYWREIWLRRVKES